MSTCLQYFSYLEINVGEENFLVAMVNDGRVVGTGKHISRTRCPKLLQDNGFSSKDNSLTGTELTYACTINMNYHATIIFNRIYMVETLWLILQLS